MAAARMHDKFDREMHRRAAAASWAAGGFSSSGNRAFDEYREETLRKLEDEQREFRDFLERLRDGEGHAPSSISSCNVEDRRADGPRGMPMGRTGGIGIGTLIVLCLIGWALGINPLDLIEGQIGPAQAAPQQQTQPAPATRGAGPLRSDGPVRCRRARKHRSAMERDLRRRRKDL